MEEIVSRKFGKEVGDEIFEDLERFDAFKCEECNNWKLIVEKSNFPPDTCKSCSGDDEWDEDNQ